MANEMVVCEIRYTVHPDNIATFEDYARSWMRLIERHGGTHLGFFVPREAPDDGSVSFPGVGAAGNPNQAVALYSFPDEETYRRYRRETPLDPEAAAVIERFASPPFESYDRLFLKPVARSTDTPGDGDAEG